MLRHELLTRDVIHADETSLRLLDTRKGGKSCSGWLWAYVSGERSGPPVVCFDSQTGRALRYPEAWLQGWHGGTLVSDGYNVYKSLADNHPGITSACCWSHARRGFANLYKASREPRAAMALRKIAGLYRIEKLIRERPVEKIRQWRQRYSRPIVNDLFAWLEEQEPCCPPEGPLNKAINYILNRRDELSCFLGDGAVPLDNNICERAIRPVVMGRKAWLFAGSLMAGNRAAQIMSLLETAKRNGLEPHAWLTDVLTRIRPVVMGRKAWLFAGSLMAGNRAAQIMSLLETAKRNGLEPHAWLTDVLTRLPEWPEDRLEELLPLEGFTFSG
ncbi:IS66 family transposase [Escherichia coli]|nr:IS66 family transposase [Escherichia coli]